jgi:hypothetical protein
VTPSGPLVAVLGLFNQSDGLSSGLIDDLLNTIPFFLGNFGHENQLFDQIFIMFVKFQSPNKLLSKFKRNAGTEALETFIFQAFH